MSGYLRIVAERARSTSPGVRPRRRTIYEPGREAESDDRAEAQRPRAAPPAARREGEARREGDPAFPQRERDPRSADSLQRSEKPKPPVVSEERSRPVAGPAGTAVEHPADSRSPTRKASELDETDAVPQAPAARGRRRVGETAERPQERSLEPVAAEELPAAAAMPTSPAVASEEPASAPSPAPSPAPESPSPLRGRPLPEGMRDADASARGVRSDPRPAPTVEVRIGRVEVRAQFSPPPTASRPAKRRAPQMSLEDYMNLRRGGASR